MLAGKAIVVTGAGQGLGLAYAQRAAALGASVVVNDLDGDNAAAAVRSIVDAGGSAISVVGSVADWDVAAELTNACIRQFGAIDGLVNNAALHHLEFPWDETEDQMRRIFEVNVLGTMYCGTHALRAMKAQRRGAIVNVASGAHIGLALRATYGATKGAVASLTYGWALEAMPHNVRINAISPTASTPMTKASADDEARFPESARLPGKGAPPASVAPMVTFLLSDLAEGVTGQIVRMTGRTINLVDHPSNAAPVEESEAWTEPTIAAAFKDVFAGRLKPVGQMAKTYAWAPSLGEDGLAGA